MYIIHSCEGLFPFLWFGLVAIFICGENENLNDHFKLAPKRLIIPITIHIYIYIFANNLIMEI